MSEHVITDEQTAKSCALVGQRPSSSPSRSARGKGYGAGRGARSSHRRLRRGMTRAFVVVAASLSMVVGLNSQAMAAGEFENNQTTMIIRDHGRYVGTVEVAIWTTNRPQGDVHAKVWGPGFSGWTHSEDVGSFTTFRGWVKVDRVLPDGAKVCAEGFWGDSSVGLPCATIEA
jgi:hypothetical protein